MKRISIIPPNETLSSVQDLLVLTDSLKKISINEDIRTVGKLAEQLIKDYISEIFDGYEKIQLQKPRFRKKFPAEVQKIIVTLLTDALIAIKKLDLQYNFDDIFSNLAEQYCTQYNIEEDDYPHYVEDIHDKINSYKKSYGKLIHDGGVKITPIQKAVHATTSHCLKVLLENKADVNLQNSSGDTALHYAVCSRSQSIEILRILLEYKADVNLANLTDRTPLMEADRNNLSEHVKILREKPGNVKIFKSPDLSSRYQAALVRQTTIDFIATNVPLKLTKDQQHQRELFAQKEYNESIKAIERKEEAKDNKRQRATEKKHRRLLYNDLENKHSSNIQHFGLIPLATTSQHGQSREGCMNRVMQVLGEIQRMTMG